MEMCAFCGRRFPAADGRLALCGACMEALCALPVQDRRYLWFERAVKRRLFAH